MVNLDANSRLAKWFVWSCDHVPCAAGSYMENNRAKTREGAYYIVRGTTLCHIFWAVLWAPLFGAMFCTLLISLLVMAHVEAHYDFVASHPYSNPILQMASYFIPEVAVLVVGLVVLIAVLSIIGGSKTGFFKLLWQYLKGIKQRICPLVHFDSVQHTTPAE